MRNFRTKTHKRCPRCNNKCLLGQSSCEECGLVFSRLQYASNAEAKKKILKFDTDFVIYTNQYPSDVKWLKLVLYAIFFGLVGGHYYYVGKYIKGGLMTASFIYLIFCAAFNIQVLAIGEYMFIPIGIAAFAWLYSLCSVLLKKFRVPILVKTIEEEKK